MSDQACLIQSNHVEGRECRENVKIIIGADFVPTDSNRSLFEKEEMNELFGKELLEELKSGDLRIFNLEAPITNAKELLPKAGSPNLKTYPQCIKVFNHLKPLVLTGANNHIYDYKDRGIQDTLNLLQSHQIHVTGFGENRTDASQPKILLINGYRIGIYACSEHEFCCAGKNHGGGNGYDPLTTFDDITCTRKQCDYLIVLFHGGRENYRYPSPGLKAICNKMVASGADLVVCQHSHCIGAYEPYKKGMIVYGQGNFLFDYNDIEEWKTSILIEVVLEKKTTQVFVIPIEKYGNCVRISKQKQKQILSDFQTRSEEIRDYGFIAKTWQEFLHSQTSVLLLRGIMGINNRFLLGIDKYMFSGRMVKILFTPKRTRLLLNYLRCESIREGILTLLEENS